MAWSGIVVRRAIRDRGRPAGELPRASRRTTGLVRSMEVVVTVPHSLRAQMCLFALLSELAIAQVRWEPPPLLGGRERSCLAYDASRARVVLFGGRADQDTFLDETWVPIRPAATALTPGGWSGAAARPR